MEPTIRPMQARDVLHCARIMAETPLWQRYNVTMTRAEIYFNDALAEDSADLFVITVDDRAVGVVWCVVRGAFDRSGYVRLLMVDGVWRGLGVGGALLDYAEAYLGAAGAEDVILLVSDFNHAAQRFYRRHGYSQVGALPDYVVQGVSELIYRKRLDGEEGNKYL